MSKSRGNTIDPLDVAEEHGADPLRLALIQAANLGQDVPLDIEWVVGARKFGNKLWNATRFVLRSVEPGSVPAEGGYPDDPSPIDAWVLGRLGEVAARFDQLADEFRFSDAYGVLYTFAWSEVFDWYLEMSKTALTGPGAAVTTRTLGVVMRDLLKLFHPAIPYLTEELWSHLVGEGLLAGAGWPAVPAYRLPEVMGDVQELIAGVRRFRAEQGLSPRRTLPLVLVDPSHRVEGWAEALVTDLAAVDLTRAAAEPGPGHGRLVAGGLEGFIPLAGVVDAGAEHARLDKAIAEAEAERARAAGRLGNPDFVGRAPAEVVEKERRKLAEIEGLLDRLRRQRSAL
jgi:valyl-tRNA synthetase